MTTASGLSTESEAARALQAEAALRERERELSQLVDMVPSHLWRLKPDGEPIFFNKRMTDFLGSGIADMDRPGMSRLDAIVQYVHPDDESKFRETLTSSLGSGESFDLRYRLRRSDGVYRWMSSRAEPVRDDKGRIVQWYGLCHDVDDQIQVEEALRRSQRQLQELVDTVPASIWSTTRNGTPEYRNKRHAAMTGVIEQPSVTGEQPSVSGGYASPLDRMAHPDDRAAAEQARAQAFESGSSYVVRYRQIRSDGTYRWTESRAEPLRDESGEIIQWYGVSVDIHDLVTAQEALRRSEQELLQLVNMLPIHIRRLSPEGETIFFNKRLIDFVGVDLAQLGERGMKGLAGTIQTLIHPDDASGLQEAISHSLATGESYARRYRVRRADGVYRWMEGRGEPVRDQNGEIVQWYGISLDVDDEVRAQEALRESERSLRELIETAPARIWCFSPDGEPTYWSRQLREYFGFDVDARDEPGRTRLSTLLRSTSHPDDADRVISLLQQNLATGKPWMTRRRQQRFDGEYRWVETHAAPMRSADGTIVQWTAVNFDIHDLVTAQEALRDREWELSQLVNMVPSLLWRLNPDGEPNFFNKRTIDFLGLDATDYDKPGMSRLAATLAAIIHRDDASAVRKAFEHSFATGEPFSMTYRLRRADGAYRWMSGRAEPRRDETGRIIQWYGLAHDIDDEMRAEEALRQSERRLQQMIDAVPVYILSFSATGEPTYINKRYQDYLGLSVPHYPSLKEQQRAIIHPDDYAEMYGTLSKCFETGTPFLLRYRRCGKDGVYRWTEGRAEPLRDQNGRIVQWYAVSLDIEDQMLAEQALRQSERRASQLVETLPALIFCAAPNGEPIYRSRQLREFLGFDVQEKEGPGRSRLNGTLDAVIHPDELEVVKERYGLSLSTGEPYALRHRLRRADGEYRWVETRAAPMRDAEGTIVQWNGICLDIEDQVQAQERLRSAQETLARASQAASLSELSASIAHEVNQPLAAVVANSHACQRWLRSDPPNLDRALITVERIIRDANAAADVVSRIRALFRHSTDSRSSTALHSVVAEVRSLMAQEAARRRVRVDVDVESNLPLVAFDRVQVQQVLINLIRNGLDAMDLASCERVLGMRVRQIGDVVQTEISDRGQGIEFPDKIFEPFFTTKENGMGMGLAICRSIVESHGGRLWAENNEPHGATFVFTLPIEVKTFQ